jgi:hypothetical protein
MSLPTHPNPGGTGARTCRGAAHRHKDARVPDRISRESVTWCRRIRSNASCALASRCSVRDRPA